MPCVLAAFCVAATDPAALARFWAIVLAREAVASPDGRGVDLPPEDEVGLRVRFRDGAVSTSGRGRMHPDLTSTSIADQEATVARALAAGARHLDVGQRPEEGHVVLADPEGNEFCVLAPGNAFLEGCGFLSSIAGEGRREVGLFWSAVLGWPLVWDRDEETAVQSARGGPKLTWGGPPVPPPAPTRVHYELVAAPGTDLDAEIERLMALGATRPGGRDERTRHDAGVLLLDPDGGELRLGPGRAD